MQAPSAGRALPRPPEHSRTLVARDGAIWIWPGIPLTKRRGHKILPIADAAIRFWIALLHGPEAFQKDLAWTVRRASEYLNIDDEVSAQRLLDTLGLTTVTLAGAIFMGVVGESAAYFPDIYVDDEGIVSGSSNASLQAALLARHFTAEWLVKAGPWDPSKHPRWPKGAPERQGGRFSPSDPGDAEPPASGAPTGRPLTVYSRKRPGIGHNQGPPLEEPPEIPDEPISGKARTVFLKSAVRWLTLAFELSDAEAVAFFALLSATSWVAEKCLPYIEAYFSPPKTLKQLQIDAYFPAPGYEIHHVGEQTQSAREGIPESAWNAPENRVRVPTLKHWLITGWYMTPTEEFGGLSPRNYLKGKSWEEKIRVGRRALIKFGVLEP
jgi:hypothetical protein